MMTGFSFDPPQSRTRWNGVTHVRWPAGAHPSQCPVYAYNELDTAAPPERVWAWLVQAPRWPEFYGNAKNVRLPASTTTLQASTTFSWTTFHFPATTTVVEYESPARLAWTGSGLGATAYHGWVILPHGQGSRIITEETQRGGIASVMRWSLRAGLSKWHQSWLEGLAARAEAGMPD